MAGQQAGYYHVVRSGSEAAQNWLMQDKEGSERMDAGEIGRAIGNSGLS